MRKTFCFPHFCFYVILSLKACGDVVYYDYKIKTLKGDNNYGSIKG